LLDREPNRIANTQLVVTRFLPDRGNVMILLAVASASSFR
jgi:hypothetical protein